MLTYRSGTCFDSYKATVAASANGTSGYGGTAPTTGWLANPGQPYAPSGDLTVCADYLRAGAYKSGTATVANTSMTSANTLPAITMSTTGACTVATS